MDKEKFREGFNRSADVSFGGRNNRVVLVTNNPSVGGRCRLPIFQVSSGFDWEGGDILLEVEEEIYSKKINDFQLIGKFIYNLDTETYKQIKNSLTDAECRHILTDEFLKFQQKNEKSKT